MDAACESIVVVGAALSADVEAPTERVHSASVTCRGQCPCRPLCPATGRRRTALRFLPDCRLDRRLAREGSPATGRYASLEIVAAVPFPVLPMCYPARLWATIDRP